MKEILVLGCGNVLASDDGVGIVVVRKLAHAPLSQNTRIIDAGVAGVGILDHFNGQEKAIIIDAVAADKEPGTILLFKWGNLPDSSIMPWSLHGMGLLQALELGYQVEPGRMPKELVIVGIQIKRVDAWRDGLCKEVEAAVPEAVRMVLNELEVKDNA